MILDRVKGGMKNVYSKTYITLYHCVANNYIVSRYMLYYPGFYQLRSLHSLPIPRDALISDMFYVRRRLALPIHTVRC
jgi:hypothetical protein